MKVLIVEDSKDAAYILQHILSPYGECVIVEDGEAAIESLEEAWGNEEPFDLLCLDIMLPKMSGLDVLSYVREREEQLELGGSLGARVVMVTAREDETTIDEALALGCEGYVFKTSGKKRMLEKLNELGLINPFEESQIASDS